MTTMRTPKCGSAGAAHDSPDIDGLVFFDGDGGEGIIVYVNITAVADDGNLIGEEVCV